MKSQLEKQESFCLFILLGWKNVLPTQHFYCFDFYVLLSTENVFFYLKSELLFGREKNMGQKKFY